MNLSSLHSRPQDRLATRLPDGSFTARNAPDGPNNGGVHGPVCDEYPVTFTLKKSDVRTKPAKEEKDCKLSKPSREPYK